MLDFSILTHYFSHYYLQGFLNTIGASLLALAGSFLLGTMIAVFRMAPIRLLNWFGAIYVEFIRNIPLVLVVLFFYYGLPSLQIVKLNGFAAGTIALAIYTASFIAEAIRAGILSVPKGQVEAARACGLTYIQTMQYVILPQAIRIVIPPLGNQFINLVKNSSVLGIVAGLDLMYYGDLVNSETFKTSDTYIFVAVFYLLLTIPLTFVVNHLERKWAKIC